MKVVTNMESSKSQM